MPPENATTSEPAHRALGLTDEEFQRISELMGREPNSLELAVFSLMWSEHCAYKHSRRLLGKLPTGGERVIFGPGENAGAVDVGEGLAVAFKVESHNHPSAVEPFQGAATGVGGILRDVFALGARPIAVLDSLRFGELASARSRYLLEQVVAGIGHYGNSIGVPTVGGDIYFEPSYEHNCLVNAMCVGIAPVKRMVRSAAAGSGNLVVLLGAATGRDGIGGASVLASAELEEGEFAKRPSVQIGDPFEEKKLMECCLELLDRRLLVALQDLGAAGLSSSSSEMASKGSVGIDIDVGKVPLREADMEPFEIMISESQERMLAIVKVDDLGEVAGVSRKWEISATAIGEVTGTGHLRVFHNSELVGDMPVSVLVDECPAYDLDAVEPEDSLACFARSLSQASREVSPEETGEMLPRTAGGASPGKAMVAAPGRTGEASPGKAMVAAPGRTGEASPDKAVEASPDKAVEASPGEILLALLGSPNVASRRWVFEQYDSIVQGRTARGPEESDAAVLKLNESGKAIAVSIDGNGRRVACDPYRGGAEVVLECAQNLACVGAAPLGLTNCLNFGNPEKPHIAWQLKRAVEGMAAACTALDVPVVGGNVSLYNEGTEGPIYPTLIVGMVGEVPDLNYAAPAGFVSEGDTVALVGPFTPSLAGSELAKMRGELEPGLPVVDLVAQRQAIEIVRGAVRDGAVKSAHDISDGGIATCIAECCILSGLGCDLDLEPLVRRSGFDQAAVLFGEGPGGVVVTGSRQDLMRLSKEAAGVGFLALGEVGGGKVRISAADATIESSVEDVRAVFERGIPGWLK